MEMEVEAKKSQARKMIFTGLPLMALCLYMTDMGQSAKLVVFLVALVFLTGVTYQYFGDPRNIFFEEKDQNESSL